MDGWVGWIGCMISTYVHKVCEEVMQDTKKYDLDGGITRMMRRVVMLRMAAFQGTACCDCIEHVGDQHFLMNQSQVCGRLTVA